MRRHVVVMGVSGTGKTTVGRLVAEALGWQFVEGDELHPPENVAAMAAGHPLTDELRAPWLAAIRDVMTSAALEDRRVVVACSALKRAYRDVLRSAQGGAWHAHIVVAPTALEERLTNRRGHFMPASLLASQLATLEALAPDEPGVEVHGAANPRRTAAAVLEALPWAQSTGTSTGRSRQ